ncbi:MAG: M23 family metallopeptidase [Bacilli bacterium]|nr:M23 family metallopeptidase [Bacilli bacterium]
MKRKEKTKNKYIIPSTDLWYITYGGYTKEDSHSYDVYGQRWAYDFDCNIDGEYYHDDGNINENYYGYNKPVLAPIDGFIVDLVDGAPDSKAYADMRVSQDSDDVRGNYLIIKAKYGEYCTICHIKKNSFKVKIGDIVNQGQEIACVGNSGRTKGAHIHMQVNKGMDFFNSEPLIIVFNNILVNNKTKSLIKVGDFVQNKK